MGPQPPGPPPQFPGSRGNYVRAPLGSGPRPRPPSPPRRRSGLLLGIVYFFLFVVLVGGAGVAYLAFNRGVDLVGAGRAGQFVHLMQVFGSFLAVVFLGETLHPYHAAGIALIAAGLVLANRRTAA